MAIPYYQNQSNTDVVVPTAEGTTISLAPDKVVQGTFYQWLTADGYLVEVAGPYTYPDLVYSWTTEEDAVPAGGINSIAVTSPLTKTGTTDVTLGLGEISASNIANGSISAAKIAFGQVVKTLNAFTDTVLISAGTGISVSNLSNTITIANTNPGLSTATGNAPITLVLEGQTLTGGISITPTNNGGAVALQTAATPTQQTGDLSVSRRIVGGNLSINAALTTGNFDEYGLYVKQTTGEAAYKYFSFVDSSDVEKVSFSASDNTLYVPAISISGYLATAGNVTTFNSVAHFNENIELDTASITGTGSLLLNLTGNSNSDSAIKVSATANSNVLYEGFNSTAGSVFKVTGDGTLTAVAIKAGQVFTQNDTFTVGSYQTVNYPVNTFVCNAVDGVITFTLPELTALSTSGMRLTFKKIDSTANAVLVSAYTAQTIDGLSQKSLTTQWSKISIESVIDISNNLFYWVIIG